MQEAISTARQRRPFTIVGALIALVTLAAFIYVATRPAGSGPIVGSVTGASVVVASVDIKARSSITSEMVQVVKLNSPPPKVFTSVADVAGTTASPRHFALIDIAAGQPILANELVTSLSDVTGPQPSFLPIPAGFVAMTIPTGEEQGVAGYISPGDYIGIIATVQGRAGSTVSRTIFNNVHVIRTGIASQTIAPGRNGPVATTAAGNSSSLTVVVNACDAEYLTWFLAKTSLRYVLESYGDYDAKNGSANNPQQVPACTIDKTTGVTDADVVKRFGANLVP